MLSGLALVGGLFSFLVARRSKMREQARRLVVRGEWVGAGSEREFRVLAENRSDEPFFYPVLEATDRKARGHVSIRYPSHVDGPRVRVGPGEDFCIPVAGEFEALDVELWFFDASHRTWRYLLRSRRLRRSSRRLHPRIRFHDDPLHLWGASGPL